MIIVLNTIRDVVKSYNAVLNDYLEEVEVMNQANELRIVGL